MDATGAADALVTDNCLAIVQTVGMLDGLRYVLQVGNVNSKHEAARVVNNCAAYSAAAAEVMVQSAGLIHALKGLCGSGGRAQRTRAKAIGAINCLSTYEETRPVISSSATSLLVSRFSRFLVSGRSGMAAWRSETQHPNTNPLCLIRVTFGALVDRTRRLGSFLDVVLGVTVAYWVDGSILLRRGWWRNPAVDEIEWLG